MYPKNFLDLFPAHERKPQVFVAMSFHEHYMPRLKAFIEPGIEMARLNAKCVQRSTVSDSILTEILADIGESRLFLADLSGPGGKPSPNVAYEVGIAHAMRQPQEVLLFRSATETEPLFDLANIRIKRYVPQETEKTLLLIAESILDALREIDLTKDRLVEKAYKAMDMPEWSVLALLLNNGGTALISLLLMDTKDGHEQTRKRLLIDRMIDDGLIAVLYFPPLSMVETADLHVPELRQSAYRITEFGLAVAERVVLERETVMQKLLFEQIDKIRARWRETGKPKQADKPAEE